MSEASLGLLRGLTTVLAMLAFIAVVGMCGYASDAALRWLNRRLTPWAPTLEALR